MRTTLKPAARVDTERRVTSTFGRAFRCGKGKALVKRNTKEVRNLDYYEFLSGHPLVQHLRGKLWHCTSRENYLSILTDGMIQPNDFTRVGVFKRKAPKLTACEKLDAISLFDFGVADDMIFRLWSVMESVDEYSLEWGKFLWWHKPITIILVPSRHKVASHIKGSEDCENVGGQWIYNVEVCHQGPIPLSAIEETIVVDASPQNHQFRSFVPTVDPDGLHKLLDQWFSGS